LTVPFPSSLPTSPAQLSRTLPLRRAVYRTGRLAARERILEIGAGNGLVATEIASRTGRKVTALDPKPFSATLPGVERATGRGEALPFESGSFDAIAFHFVLLWLTEPVAVLREALRVLSAGGVLLFLAEPDLTLRRDEPDTGLGRLIAGTISGAGGHPDAGSELRGWLKEADFRPKLHTTGEEWITVTDPEETLDEVRFLVAAGTLTEGDADGLARAEREAVLTGSRRVLLPVTFGIAEKEDDFEL